MTTFVLGSERRAEMSVCARPGDQPVTRAVPAGTTHAVWPRSRTTVCGGVPVIVWEGREWPGEAEWGEPCPECTALVGLL